MQALEADRIHRLLIDPDFLFLQKTLARPNLFGTVAASHIEMWHSAFISWLLDPGSRIGTKDFPLKRFLYLCLTHGESSLSPSTDPVPTWAQFEGIEFAPEQIDFATEFKHEKLVNDSGAELRADVFAQTELLPTASPQRKSADSTPATLVAFRLLIENKVKARESGDQTLHYARFARQTQDKSTVTLLVFLTPDDAQSPQSPDFIKITYQQLYDYVLLPCSRHPQLDQEARFLIEQYILNLGKPLKTRGGRKVMANINQEICTRIYAAHREVLDEIFLAVKGETPKPAEVARTVRRFSVTLDQMLDAGLIALSDTLYSSYRNAGYSARFKRGEDGSVLIVTTQGEYASPSSAAQELSGQSVNGWVFWEVLDESGRNRGTLSELRDELTSATE